MKNDSLTKSLIISEMAHIADLIEQGEELPVIQTETAELHKIACDGDLERAKELIEK